MPCSFVGGRFIDGGESVCDRIAFDIEFVGYTGAMSLIRWAAFDPTTLRRVAIGATPARPAAEDRFADDVVAEAANDRTSAQVLVPLPPQPLCVFIRVFAYQDDEDKTRLDYVDTSPFDPFDATNESCRALVATTPPGG